APNLQRKEETEQQYIQSLEATLARLTIQSQPQYQPPLQPDQRSHLIPQQQPRHSPQFQQPLSSQIHSPFQYQSQLQPPFQYNPQYQLQYQQGKGEPYYDWISLGADNIITNAYGNATGQASSSKNHAHKRENASDMSALPSENGVSIPARPSGYSANQRITLADIGQMPPPPPPSAQPLISQGSATGNGVNPVGYLHVKLNDTEARKDNTNDGDRGSMQEQTSRIRIVINRWNGNKSKWEDFEEEFKKSKDTPDTAATFKRHMDVDNEKKVDYEEIEIHSQALKNLMAETDEWWRDFVTKSTQPITIGAPFDPFVWNWDRYVEACEHKSDDTPALKEARQDLKNLMQLIASSKDLETYFRSRDVLRSSKKIRFDYLWTLFGHGAKVYARSYMNDLQMFEVTSCRVLSSAGKRFRICGSAFDWDGSKFSTYSYDFYIKEFAGEKPISSLEVFPTEFFCNNDGNYDDSQLRQRLVERGRKYCKLCTEEPANLQCGYQGTAIVTPSALHRLTAKNRGEDPLSSYSDPRVASYDELDVTSIDIAGKQNRVIIDNYAFLKSERNTMKRGDMPPLGKKVPYSEPGCVCSICKSSPLQQWRPESKPVHSSSALGKAFSENETRLLFLPPRLLGFALKDKVWGQFLVDNLTLLSFSDNQEQSDPFWGELQLENESKELLMAYVEHHRAPSSRGPSGQETSGTDSKAFDVIEGKGQGLAILLHGPPGVGKTLTAETIALATNRPLLTVSVAEIGIGPDEAERKLTDVFSDAARWKAVLLMDEADVFVEERMKGDLGRNALVSVLLRCLEYYDGMIILTTNRVRSIDAAVQSRIHLAIQYHDLTAQQRLAIYKNRLKWIPDEEIENRNRKGLEKGLENSPLIKRSNKANGRQIRNIVAGARALAKSKDQLLSLEHLVAVDETTSNFIRSMADLMQKQRARNEVDFEQ
ncbi:MAG: hypothetical protein Q9165_008922, partial [Trypethelium subeluteriae]